MNRTTTTEFNSYETLELDNQDGFLTVWLNRPEARNALSGEMMTELLDLFNTLRISTGIRAVTLRGKGGVFCAGGDLKGFKAIFQGEDQSIYDITRANEEMGTLLDLINESPQVTIALVEGAAMAGGFGILCACDLVAVTKDAKFAMTETTIGIPPAQIAPFVAARIGLPAARRLALTGGRLTGADTLTLGLADHVADDAEGLVEYEATMRHRIRKCAPGANAITKDILLATRTMDRAEMIKHASQGFARAMLSDEGRDGVASFLEKRAPYWAAKPETTEG